MVAAMLPVAAFAAVPEAYAVYVNTDGTLTFYYDDQKGSREGNNKYEVGNGTNLGWHACNPKYIVIDESFKDYDGLVTAKNFFNCNEDDYSDGVVQDVTLTNLLNIEGLEYFNTSNVTDMSKMFYYYTYDKDVTAVLDLSNFDTSKVTNMSDMFESCSNVTEFDLSSFNTSKVTDMCWMFNDCSAVRTLDLSSFDTSKVTDMNHMFLFSGITALNLSGFDTSLVTNMSGMFQTCSALKTVMVGDGWTAENVTMLTNMFEGCESLVGEKGTEYEENNDPKIYARIDGGPGAPGYFCGGTSDLSIAKIDDVDYPVYGDTTYEEQLYDVTSTSWAQPGTVEWPDADGGWTGTAPTGITVDKNGYVEVSPFVPAGDYTFRVRDSRDLYVTEPATLTILPKPATVTADNKEMFCNDAQSPELTATVEGLVGEDTISYTLSRKAGTDVGKYEITATGDAAQGNYTVTYVPGTFTIKHKTLKAVPGKEADEGVAGYKPCYKCEGCSKYYEEAAGTTLIGDENAYKAWISEGGRGYIAPLAHEHVMTEVPGKAAKEGVAGFKASFECTGCGKYFEDKAGTKEIGGETAYKAWTGKGGKGYIAPLEPEKPTEPEPVAYKLLEGEGQTFTDDKDATFRSAADLLKFDKVLVDGDVVGKMNYEVKEGSTIVTLKAAYLKTLAGGKHTIVIVSSDGQAETTFFLNKPGVVNTGDANNVAFWIALAAVALAATGAAVISRRKAQR